MTIASGRTLIVAFVLVGFTALPSLAVSPATIAEGRALFQRQWRPANPMMGSDGLGPLFNGQSCASCHHQGGVGGGGEARFNTKFIGLEAVDIVGGKVDQDVIAQTLGTFHPGFIHATGFIDYKLPLSHHGGSPMYQNSRAALMQQVDSMFSNEGGPTEASEVQRALATPILFNNKVGPYKISLRARMFHRNTTPLYGLGLISGVNGRQLEQQVRAQKKHPEISGRLATLSDGRYGRFGWRGKASTLLEYVDLASASHLGLETKRVKQPRDPMMPEYRNPATDLHDQQLRAIRDFIAALPAPIRSLDSADSRTRAMAMRGEKLFASIGCAVCHVPTLGPVEGLYSDLLLHDMGSGLSDLDHADPHIVKAIPITNKFGTVKNEREFSGKKRFAPMVEALPNMRFKPIRSGTRTELRRFGQSINGPPRSLDRARMLTSSMNYYFQAPSGPMQLKRFINPRTVNREVYTSAPTRSRDDWIVESSCGGGFHQTIMDSVNTPTTDVTTEVYIQLNYERTNFNQEWRTPPLWGVRDSAPYMHDGRAETLLEAIAMHDGEASGTRDRFLQLPLIDRHAIVAFLNTMVVSPTTPKANL